MNTLNQVYVQSVSRSNRFARAFAACLGFLAFAAPTVAESHESNARLVENAREWRGVVDPALPYRPSLSEMRQALSDPSSTTFDWDEVYEVEHQIPLPGGAYLAVTESFTLRSWLRRPSRAVVFLSGSVFRGNHWDIPVEGYDGTADAARRGFFVYTVDYLGVGDSYRPADGLEATVDANLDAVKTLLRYVRFFRPANKIDLVGEGYGGALATLAAADDRRVRSVTMSAMIYRDVNGGPLTDPFFLDLLRSQPDGYFFIPGESSGIFLDGAPPEVFQYVAATQGGFYPTLNFLVAADRPYFDPKVARAPGLVLWGPGDFIAVPSDIEALARDYGRHGAILSVNPQAGHAPRTQGPAIAEWFWTQIFDFIDP